MLRGQPSFAVPRVVAKVILCLACWSLHSSLLHWQGTIQNPLLALCSTMTILPAKRVHSYVKLHIFALLVFQFVSWCRHQTTLQCTSYIAIYQAYQKGLRSL